ncbi:MAG: preprotein translocase subunit YajC [Proteobacteria bacterium]|jgi:preprotein translocase subunit YajC|nr:preprotein translocase subunit YajC [Pseudomonadota bacterium]
MPEITEVLISYEPAPTAARPFWIDLLPIVLIGAIIYFLIIRPQQQERTKHVSLIDSLVKGNRVVTSNGIHGRIVEVRGDTVLLEIAEKTRIVIDKQAVARRIQPESKG